MRALEVADLHKRYGSAVALRGLDFAVDAGVVTGFLGPNGAGKTTTLRIVLDLVRADRGSVRLFGRPASDPRLRARVGYLPGDLRLWSDLRGLDLLDAFARMRRQRPPVLRERLLAALMLGPADLARRVKHLSHGTRQKLGLVIAMQHDPDLLLLDEPTSGLDPLVQRAFLDLVAERAHEGRAVLLSSHVLSEVDSVCGRVLLLRAGAIVAHEAIEILRARTVRRARVRFRGEPPDLADVPGVALDGGSGRTVELRLQGDVGPLLRALAAHDVEELLLPEPRLEDVFLAFYGDGGGPP